MEKFLNFSKFLYIFFIFKVYKNSKSFENFKNFYFFQIIPNSSPFLLNPIDHQYMYTYNKFVCKKINLNSNILP